MSEFVKKILVTFSVQDVNVELDVNCDAEQTQKYCEQETERDIDTKQKIAFVEVYCVVKAICDNRGKIVCVENTENEVLFTVEFASVEELTKCTKNLETMKKMIEIATR